MRLRNKVALITGAAVGIGAEIAKRFAAEGAQVVIGDVNAVEARTTSERIRRSGGSARSVLLDVTKEESWKEALDGIRTAEGRLDVLVNNAGITKRIPITEMPLEDFEQIMAVNVRGVFLGIKHALPFMKQHGGGSIVNISSICGLVGHKLTNETYTTSKGAVTLLTKSVAVRHARDNIRCNSIHPGTVDTPMVQALFADPEKKRERLDEVPLGRLATARDVANAALFLASDEAGFITGAALPVDGGLTAY
ncbi:MAG: SDR family NAD(P)-dependent oxidoreductase [candidate division NC10 bacterium]|nr:SDR family NAD(P)-dependent oxidoreductase [candidate division NC10 bacterium]